MKNHYLISFLFLASVISANVKAQSTERIKPIHLQTDKMLYVSGENIGFKCTSNLPGQHTGAILFVDICGEGYILSSHILKIENNQWNGEIEIPDSVQTGIYVLRAYVGDDQGHPAIESQLVSILNRFGNNANNEKKRQDASYQPVNQLTYPVSSGELLKVYAQKNFCSSGDVIQFHIENKLQKYTGGISFSVFKVDDLARGANDNSSVYSEYTYNENIKIYNSYTIRGKLYNKKQGKPATDEMVFLSIPDSIPQIKYDFTDENGTFRFQFNDYYQKDEVIIQTQDKSNQYNITLYPSQLMPPEKIPFYIPSNVENSELAKLAVQRATLHKAYSPKNLEKLVDPEYKYPFYGVAETRVYPAKYIDLEDFKEIAWEILPPVKYRSLKDSVYIKIWNYHLNLFLNNPMLLVDGVPISSPASLNVFNSQSIKWIDIQPRIKCYGNLMFEGLMNVQTYEGDFTGIEMPVNAIRTRLEAYYIPEHTRQEKPLFRDVLCWEPYIDTKEKASKIDVQCSYEKGKYNHFCRIQYALTPCD